VLINEFSNKWIFLEKNKPISMPTSKHWVINPSDELPPIVDEKGFGSRPPLTVVQMLKQTVNKFGSEKAYAIKRPVNVSNFFRINICYLSVFRDKFQKTGSSLPGMIIIVMHKPLLNP
jgi:hypothetical protein